MNGAGAYIGSNFLQSVRRGGLEAFALLGVFLHFAVPAAYEISGPATQGLLTTVICSGGVAIEVVIDKDGKPIKTNRAVGHNDCNSGCLHHCAALAVSAVNLISPRWAIPLAALTATVFANSQVPSASPPRGPPH